MAEAAAAEAIITFALGSAPEKCELASLLACGYFTNSKHDKEIIFH